MANLKKLVKENNLQSQAAFYLDSIGYQLSQLGYGRNIISRNLKIVCMIASRYENSADVTKILDKVVERGINEERDIEGLISAIQARERDCDPNAPRTLNILERRIGEIMSGREFLEENHVNPAHRNNVGRSHCQYHGGNYRD